MSRQRVAKQQQDREPVVDLDAIQDKPVRPQSDFDGWCAEQDQQWGEQTRRGVFR